MPIHYKPIVANQIERLLELKYWEAARMRPAEFFETLSPLASLAVAAPESGDTSVRVLIVIPHCLVSLQYQASKLYVPEPESHLAQRQYPHEQAIAHASDRTSFLQDVRDFMNNPTRRNWEAAERTRIEAFIKAQLANSTAQKVLDKIKENIETLERERKTHETSLARIVPQFGHVQVSEAFVGKLAAGEQATPYLVFDTNVHAEEPGKPKQEILREMTSRKRRVLTPTEFVALATHHPDRLKNGQFDFLRPDGAEYFYKHSTGAGAELLVGEPIFGVMREHFVYADCRE
jgi:hypothetical protein